MNIILLDKNSQSLIKGRLEKAELSDMKTITDGWEFNWRKHFNLPHSKAFKVITNSNAGRIEGLMIFQKIKNEEPYMAYLESAPHNRGTEKKLDYVAGCLIGKAYELSNMEGRNFYKGFLSFKCTNEKVMKVYHDKYGAVRVGQSMMYIEPIAGNKIVNEYLLRQLIA